MQKEEHYIDCFVYEIELTSRVCHEVFKKWFENHTSNLLNTEEMTIMDTLDCNKNLSQIELAKTILKGKAHTGKFLDGLEAKGYITRIYDTKNSRMVKIPVMTELGKEVYKKTIEELKELLKHSRTKISEIEKVEF